MYQIGILEDHLPDKEEEDPHHALQDHPREEAEEAVVVGEAAAVEEEHFHCPDTRLPNQLKNF